ncbi:hypothetical protein EZV62_001860 [Acer yangbiense]|uniref:C2H2-type domain-containing protein n=1 Tax=Acer yangbiense TaxID=1000413 RepID=A0A5C7IVH0_9ROSI|nr:hypothetical protein EZV62_001860 [Acer yangbiense]
MGAFSGFNNQITPCRNIDSCDDGPKYDGRTHSLPCKKNGLYKCPKCEGLCNTSQNFTAHIRFHYKNESPAERKRRTKAKYKNKSKLRLVNSEKNEAIRERNSRLVKKTEEETMVVAEQLEFYLKNNVETNVEGDVWIMEVVGGCPRKEQRRRRRSSPENPIGYVPVLVDGDVVRRRKGTKTSPEIVAGKSYRSSTQI